MTDPLSPPQPEPPPCSNCGSEDRDHRGILRCECPDHPAAEPPREAQQDWTPDAVLGRHTG